MPEGRTKPDDGETKRLAAASSQHHRCTCEQRMAAMQAEIERLRLEDAKRQEHDEQMVGVCMVLNARVSELEHSNRTLRALHNLDPPKPTKTDGWLDTKQVMAITELSESAVRNWINDSGKPGTKGEKVVIRRFGRPVWIKADTLPPGADKRGSRSLSASIRITK
jgi:hypothetical protein